MTSSAVRAVLTDFWFHKLRRSVSHVSRPVRCAARLWGVIAIIVWIVQWTSDYRRSRTAQDILDERFAQGEIDRTEYEEKRKLIGSRTGDW